MEINYEDEEQDVYLLTKYPFPFFIISTQYDSEKYVDEDHLIMDKGKEFYEKLTTGKKVISKKEFPDELVDFLLPEYKNNKYVIHLPNYYEMTEEFLETSTREPIVNIPKLERILEGFDGARPESFVILGNSVFFANDYRAGLADECVKTITTYYHINKMAQELRKKAENSFYTSINTLGDLSSKAHSGVGGNTYLNHDVLAVVNGHVVNIGG